MKSTAVTTEPTPALLTTAEVAKVLQISQRRVEQLITAGRLAAYRAGPLWMVDPHELTRPRIRLRKPGRPRSTKRKPYLAPPPRPVPVPSGPGYAEAQK